MIVKTAVIVGEFEDDFKFPEFYDYNACFECPFRFEDQGLVDWCDIVDEVNGVQRCPFHGGDDTCVHKREQGDR